MADEGRDVDIAEALWVQLLGVESLTCQRCVGQAEVTIAQLERASRTALYFEAEWQRPGAVEWEQVGLTVRWRRLRQPERALSDGWARRLDVLVYAYDGGRRLLNQCNVSLDPGWLAQERGSFTLTYRGLEVRWPQHDPEWTARAQEWAGRIGLTVQEGQVELGAFEVEEMTFIPSPEEFLQNLLLTALLRAHFHGRLTLPGVPQPKPSRPQQVRERRAAYQPAPPEIPAPLPIATLRRYLQAHGFHFPTELIAAYYLALKSKPFAILTGVSGTGKTKLAQLFADFLTGGNAAQQVFVSVRPDWLDPRGLLGFPNLLTGTYQATDCLRLLLRAEVNWRFGPHVPFFVLLDELNLARVEYYFADFLSALESRRFDAQGEVVQEPVHLHAERACLATEPFPRTEAAGPYTCPDYEPLADGTCGRYSHCPLVREVGRQTVIFVPPRLYVPRHVYFTGTVNVDESTYSLSPKVLDRANTLEFHAVDFEAYFAPASIEPPTPEEQAGIVADFTRRGRFYEPPQAANWEVAALAPYRRQLAVLTAALEPYELHFGYRVAAEIMEYLRHAYDLLQREEVLLETPTGPRPMTLDDAFDQQLGQKILPKFQGPAGRLEEPLAVLLRACLGEEDEGLPLATLEEQAAQGKGVRYPRTAAKVRRLLRDLRWQGYAGGI